MAKRSYGQDSPNEPEYVSLGGQYSRYGISKTGYMKIIDIDYPIQADGNGNISLLGEGGERRSYKLKELGRAVFGKHWSPKFKKGESHRRVVAFTPETGKTETFDNLHQAAKKTGTSYNAVKNACDATDDERRMANGLVWRYEAPGGEGPESPKAAAEAPQPEGLPPRKRTTGVEIIRTPPGGGKPTRYQSITQASQAAGVTHKAMHRLVKGNLPSADGSKWVWADTPPKPKAKKAQAEAKDELQSSPEASPKAQASPPKEWRSADVAGFPKFEVTIDGQLRDAETLEPKDVAADGQFHIYVSRGVFKHVNPKELVRAVFPDKFPVPIHALAGVPVYDKPPTDLGDCGYVSLRDLAKANNQIKVIE